MVRQAGFSYLWTLFLLAAIGVGLMLAEEVHHTSVQRDKERELIFIGRQFREALRAYVEVTPGAAKQYPESLEALLLDPRLPGNHRYLRRLYTDPMTGKTEWGVRRVAGKIVGVYSLSEGKPIKIGNFEVSEAAFSDKKKYSEWVFTHPYDLLVNAGDTPTPPEGDAVKPGGVMTPIADEKKRADDGK